MLCLLFLASLSVAESATLEAKEGPATRETEKSATAKGSGKDPTTSPEKRAETSTKVSKEAKKQPAGQESVRKSPPPESKPKVAEKGDTGALFSVEESERAHKEQISIHEMVSEKAGGESLFSVEEAEKAGKEQTSIHEMVPEKAKEEKDVSLFSVEKAEKEAKRRIARPKIRARRPHVTRRKAEKAEKEAREKVPLTRRKAEKKKDDWVKIELGFAYKDIQLFQGSYTFESHFIGEMVNKSGRDFGIVKFMFSAYDRRGKLISEEPFQITDFYDGQIKTFKGTVVDGYKDITSHKIRFISGAPTAG